MGAMPPQTEIGFMPPPGGKPPVPQDDYTLMAGIRAGESAALAALYDRYSGSVYALIIRALRDPRDAEDLLIDIFSEIWERRERFDPSRGTPVGHLMGLARSRLVDRLRSKKSFARMGGENSPDAIDSMAQLGDTDRGPLDSVIVSEQREKVIKALSALPIEQRRALELCYYQALSHSEVAERLGQPLGTIKSRIRQALLHLRDKLPPEQ